MGYINFLGKELNKIKERRQFYKKWWFWVIVIILLPQIYSSVIGALNKPDDLFYCEKDSDCATSIFKVWQFCPSCPYAVNVQAEKYLSVRRNVVSNMFLSVSGLCPVYECCGGEIKCEENKCEALSDCT